MTVAAMEYYTMSVMKHRCADRSYCQDVWFVLACNGTHAVIQVCGSGEGYRFGKEPRTVLISEFDWTPAGELAQALAA